MVQEMATEVLGELGPSFASLWASPAKHGNGEFEWKWKVRLQRHLGLLYPQFNDIVACDVQSLKTLLFFQSRKT